MVALFIKQLRGLVVRSRWRTDGVVDEVWGGRSEIPTRQTQKYSFQDFDRKLSYLSGRGVRFKSETGVHGVS